MKSKTIYILIAVLVLICITASVVSVKFYNDAKTNGELYLKVLDEYGSNAVDREEKEYSSFLNNLDSDQSKLYSEAYSRAAEEEHDDAWDDGYYTGVKEIEDKRKTDRFISGVIATFLFFGGMLLVDTYYKKRK